MKAYIACLEALEQGNMSSFMIIKPSLVCFFYSTSKIENDQNDQQGYVVIYFLLICFENKLNNFVGLREKVKKSEPFNV